MLAVVHVLAISLLAVGCGKQTTPLPTPPSHTAKGVSFTTQDGVELKGRVFGGGKTGVVLAHMFPADQSSWWAFAEVLSDKGYMALTFNFRGFGEGTEKSGGSKEIERIDQDLEAALEFLTGQDVTRVYLVGASMGATVSLMVAADRDVAGVVSLSAPEEFKGLSVKGERIEVPVLLMATNGDRGAKNSVESMIEDGTVGEQAEHVIYLEGGDHGTDILQGENGDAARERILRFLEAHGR
jgi:alpha-beta hydrolase superfamily lysophospholipase